MKLNELGTDPDYRFTLANERTFLAWVRTALSFFISSIALEGLKKYSESNFEYDLIIIVLALISLALIFFAYFRWRNTELLIRKGQPINYTFFIFLLAFVLFLLCFLFFLEVFFGTRFRFAI